MTAEEINRKRVEHCKRLSAIAAEKKVTQIDLASTYRHETIGYKPAFFREGITFTGFSDNCC